MHDVEMIGIGTSQQGEGHGDSLAPPLPPLQGGRGRFFAAAAQLASRNGPPAAAGSACISRTKAAIRGAMIER